MKHVLITGATKGIGRACAETFADKGWAVTAVARTVSDLEEMKAVWGTDFPGQQLHTVAADLSTSLGVEGIPVQAYDVIILNAAAFRPGRLLRQEDQFEDLLGLNVLGNHRLVRRLLPALIEEGRGHLVVIGSTGTDNWKGHMTAYVTTKYALRGLFYGWQKDLEGSGVLATLVAPGATLTASWADETPPPDILDPTEVASAVWRAVNDGFEGRVVVENRRQKVEDRR